MCDRKIKIKIKIGLSYDTKNDKSTSVISLSSCDSPHRPLSETYCSWVESDPEGALCLNLLPSFITVPSPSLQSRSGSVFVIFILILCTEY